MLPHDEEASSLLRDDVVMFRNHAALLTERSDMGVFASASG
jgi:hypothetical protein